MLLGYIPNNKRKCLNILSIQLFIMKYQKRYIPDEEFEILYCASNHRIRTIISILRYTGLRSIEVLRLKQTDVDHLTKTIHVRVAKKKKTVYVKKWLPPRVFKQLKRYLYGNNLNDTPWLFPAFYNRSKHYPQDALYSYLIRVCQRNFIHPEDKTS